MSDIGKILARVELGQKFNAYDLTSGGYTIGIGPITDCLGLATTQSEAVADLIVDSLRAGRLRATAGPVGALFRHTAEDERWMLESFGAAEFEKLSADGHADLAADLLRDAEARDRAGEPGAGSRIRAAANFIRAAVDLRAIVVEGQK